MRLGSTPRVLAKKRAFARGLLRGLSAAQAARNAGYAQGPRARAWRAAGLYRRDGANVIGTWLRRDPDVLEEVERLASEVWHSAEVQAELGKLLRR